jgi:hypothetical protein
VLSFLLKFLFVVLLGQLLAGLLRMLTGRRATSLPRRNPDAHESVSTRKLGDDIVDAEFEELDPEAEK